MFNIIKKCTWKWGMILIALILSISLDAQDVIKLDRSKAFYHPYIVEPGMILDVNEAIEQALSSYSDLARMVDAKSGKVNQSSMSRFMDLFIPAALVYQDYLDSIPNGQEMVTVGKYSNTVFDILEPNGFEFTIEKAVLIEITPSSNKEWYSSVVEVTKIRHNMISKDNKEIIRASNKSIVLRFTFDIPISNPKKATIARIEPKKEIKIIDYYTRLITIYAGTGTSRYRLNRSDFWDREHGNSTLESNDGLKFSIGFEYITDRFTTAKESNRRKLALITGLRYSSYQLNTTLSAFALRPFDEEISFSNNSNMDTIQRYTRLVNPVYAEEDLRFGILEIPLGIGINAIKKRNTTIYFNFKAVPALILSGNGNISGMADYDAILQYQDDEGEWVESNFQLLNNENTLDANLLINNEGFGPYEVGRKIIELDSKPNLRSSNLSFEFSPTVYLNFKNKKKSRWGLMVAMDVRYQFGSFMKHKPIERAEDEVFKSDDDYNGSILNYYTEDLSSLTFGIRLGLIQRSIIDYRNWD